MVDFRRASSFSIKTIAVCSKCDLSRGVAFRELRSIQLEGPEVVKVEDSFYVVAGADDDERSDFFLFHECQGC